MLEQLNLAQRDAASDEKRIKQLEQRLLDLYDRSSSR